MNKYNFLYPILIVIFLAVGCNTDSRVEFVKNENQIDVLIDEQLITSYLHADDLLKPCLYPVKILSGEVVTRAFPFEVIEGESDDHPHHTGVYFTYGSKGEVNGDHFWNMHDIPPQIKHIEVLDTELKKNEGKITTISHWISSKNKPILEEKREMGFEVMENGYHIEAERTLKMANQLGIKIYRMGGLQYDESKSIEKNLAEFKAIFKNLSQLNEEYKIHGACQNHAGSNRVSASV